MDIVIYMNEQDFLHKIGLPTKEEPEAGSTTAFWSMKRIPKYFTAKDKIFLAKKGHIMGYVECEEFNWDDIGGETLVWESDTFKYINSISCKPFRGFKYRQFEYELENTRVA